MRSVGVDIGSRTIKIVEIVNGELVFSHIEENTFKPLQICHNILKDIKFDKITATGYGRHLFAKHYDCEIISEIKAFSIGVFYQYPDCRTILDIGGQDTKAINIDESGKLRKFEMNDKCAAGTGKFLEIMAMALGYEIDEFWQEAMSSEKSVKVNNMCAVFAESEVISIVSKGVPNNEVALGIHQSVAQRAKAMLKKVGIKDKLVFVGGVAQNKCLVQLLEKEISKNIIIPKNPQILGALGCALNGADGL